MSSSRCIFAVIISIVNIHKYYRYYNHTVDFYHCYYNDDDRNEWFNYEYVLHDDADKTRKDNADTNCNNTNNNDNHKNNKKEEGVNSDIDIKKRYHYIFSFPDDLHEDVCGGSGRDVGERKQGIKGKYSWKRVLLTSKVRVNEFAAKNPIPAYFVAVLTIMRLTRMCKRLAGCGTYCISFW